MGNAISKLPQDFNPHRMVGKIYQQRNEAITTGKAIDWALAEQLAWGTLLMEGNHVRHPNPNPLILTSRASPLFIISPLTSPLIPTLISPLISPDGLPYMAGAHLGPGRGAWYLL